MMGRAEPKAGRPRLAASCKSSRGFLPAPVVYAALFALSLALAGWLEPGMGMGYYLSALAAVILMFSSPWMLLGCGAGWLIRQLRRKTPEHIIIRLLPVCYIIIGAMLLRVMKTLALSV